MDDAVTRRAPRVRTRSDGFRNRLRSDFARRSYGRRLAENFFERDGVSPDAARLLGPADERTETKDELPLFR